MPFDVIVEAQQQRDMQGFAGRHRAGTIEPRMRESQRLASAAFRRDQMAILLPAMAMVAPTCPTDRLGQYLGHAGARDAVNVA